MFLPKEPQAKFRLADLPALAPLILPQGKGKNEDKQVHVPAKAPSAQVKPAQAVTRVQGDTEQPVQGMAGDAWGHTAEEQADKQAHKSTQPPQGMVADPRMCGAHEKPLQAEMHRAAAPDAQAHGAEEKQKQHEAAEALQVSRAAEHNPQGAAPGAQAQGRKEKPSQTDEEDKQVHVAAKQGSHGVAAEGRAADPQAHGDEEQPQAGPPPPSLWFRGQDYNASTTVVLT